jgi:hypothetical protein
MSCQEMESIVILCGQTLHESKEVWGLKAISLQIRSVDAPTFLEKMPPTTFWPQILFYLLLEHMKQNLKVLKCITGTVSKIFPQLLQFFQHLTIATYMEIRVL